MSSDLIALLETLGSWLGGVAAHLFALVLAPLLDSVCQHLLPPHPSTEPVADLILEVRSLS